ncbi:HalOD1 output domain-containing protein [Natronorubrum sp. DTA28]|uniref:HalOD1 output domain-containing protein n=1 Tax=Natronorubrum sp. DTA28 TaxID=3447019 RepID=UPI003F827720
MSSASDPPSPPERTSVPTQAVIEAIAAREGVDVTDVEPPAYEPLYTVVDPAALDRLFRTPSAICPDARVSFEYEGYDVVVHSDGRVDVSERSATGETEFSIGRSLEE